MIKLTEPQIELLSKLKDDNRNGFDDWACDHSDEEDDDMEILISKGLASSILGEQYYITKKGISFLHEHK